MRKLSIPEVKNLKARAISNLADINYTLTVFRDYHTKPEEKTNQYTYSYVHDDLGNLCDTIYFDVDCTGTMYITKSFEDNKIYEENHFCKEKISELIKLNEFQLMKWYETLIKYEVDKLVKEVNSI